MARQFNQKTCPVCGKVFTPTGGHQKYCGDECRGYPSHKKGASAKVKADAKPQVTVLTEAESQEAFKDSRFGGVRWMDVDGTRWYVLSDVCKCLGIGNPSDAAKGLLDKERGSIEIPREPGSFGGNPNVLIVTKPGVFHLMNNCRDTPVTQPIKERINHEILPSVDETGVYISPTNIDIDAMIANAMQTVKIAQAAAQTSQAAAQALLASVTSMTMAKQAMNEVHDLSGSFNVYTVKTDEHLAQIDEQQVELKEQIDQVDKVKYCNPNAQGIPSDVAKEYRRLSAWEINKWLADAGYQEKGSDGKWRITSKARAMQEPIVVEVQYSYTDKNGNPRIGYRVKLTGYGIAWVHMMAKENGYERIAEEPEQTFMTGM